MPLRDITEDLFTAIEEGRFESIPQLAADYKRAIQKYLRTGEQGPAPLQLTDLLEPLEKAIQYLRVIRAHQCAQFQKLARDSVYWSLSPVSKRGSLNVDA